MTRRWTATLCALLGLSLIAPIGTEPASAHNRSESYSNWSLTDSGAVAVITVSTGEVGALLSPSDPKPLAVAFGEHALTSVQAFGEGPCPAAVWRELDAARGFLRIEIEFECMDGGVEAIQYRALFDVLPIHVHYLTVTTRGEPLGEAVITDRADRWQRPETVQSHSFAAFFSLGWSHILGGIDHIAFLAGLLLIAGSAGRAVLSVTGFTLGHSLSLAAAVTGVVAANARLVEAFIGFTVALVACEYVAQRRAATALGIAAMLVAVVTGALALTAGTAVGRDATMYLGFGAFAACYLPLSGRAAATSSGLDARGLFALTTAFGIVHGFGFAGFLLDTGLAGSSLAIPLLGFNLGVEAGQLALVAVAMAAAALLRKRRVERVAPLISALLCGIGLYWFVGRSLGV